MRFSNWNVYVCMFISSHSIMRFCIDQRPHSFIINVVYTQLHDCIGIPYPCVSNKEVPLILILNYNTMKKCCCRIEPI